MSLGCNYIDMNIKEIVTRMFFPVEFEKGKLRVFVNEDAGTLELDIKSLKESDVVQRQLKAVEKIFND